MERCVIVDYEFLQPQLRHSKRVPSKPQSYQHLRRLLSRTWGCKRLTQQEAPARGSIPGGMHQGRGFRCKRGMAFRVPSHNEHPLVVWPKEEARDVRHTPTEELRLRSSRRG